VRNVGCILVSLAAADTAAACREMAACAATLRTLAELSATLLRTACVDGWFHVLLMAVAEIGPIDTPRRRVMVMRWPLMIRPPAPLSACASSVMATAPTTRSAPKAENGASASVTAA
jgi:hypothetical protein